MAGAGRTARGAGPVLKGRGGAGLGARAQATIEFTITFGLLATFVAIAALGAQRESQGRQLGVFVGAADSNLRLLGSAVDSAVAGGLGSKVVVTLYYPSAPDGMQIVWYGSGPTGHTPRADNLNVLSYSIDIPSGDPQLQYKTTLRGSLEQIQVGTQAAKFPTGVSATDRRVEAGYNKYEIEVRHLGVVSIKRVGGAA